MPGPIQYTSPAGVEVHTIVPTYASVRFLPQDQSGSILFGTGDMVVDQATSAFLGVIPVQSGVPNVNVGFPQIAGMSLNTSLGPITGQQFLDALTNLFDQLYLAAP
jgi:hypothetical protein